MSNSGKISVVYFTHYTDLYGANKSLLNLIDGLKGYHDVTVAVVTHSKGPIVDALNKRNVTCYIWPFFNETYSGDTNHFKVTIKGLVKFLYNWVTVIRYAPVLRRREVNIIHSNSSATLIGAYFALWLKVSHIWHIREFGWEDYKLKYNFGYSQFRYWLRKATVVISISRAIYNKRLSGERLKNNEIVYNGVVSDQVLPNNKAALNVSKRALTTFSIIGVISEEKNQLEALEAFKLLCKDKDDVRLLIVGQGYDNYVHQLKEMVKQKDLDDKVQFTGYTANIEDIYSKTDFLLMCSRNEALGRVTLEAMSHCIPVIGFDGEGTAEIISHKVNGLLYSKGYNELYYQMKMAMEDEALVQKMKMNAIDTVRENFTIEKYVSSIHKIYSHYQ